MTNRAVDNELVGLVKVDNWDRLADALAARGHDRGAVFHLPELDESSHDRPLLLAVLVVEPPLQQVARATEFSKLI